MKNRMMKIVMLCGVMMLATAMFTACAPKEEESVKQTEQVQGDMPVDENAETEDSAVKFKPSQLGLVSRDKYEYPYIGMNFTLTEAMIGKMDSFDVTMLNEDEYDQEEGTLNYAAFYWYGLTEEQKNEEATAIDFEAWKESLAQIGALGIYKTEYAEKLDELTGCSEHKELGKSADGKYVYYMSFSDEAAELREELEKTEVEFTEMLPLNLEMGEGAFSEGRVDASNVGDFSTIDINGDVQGKEMFKDYKLTLVNLFATWCSPCVQEMPELEKLKQEMADKGVNVTAVVLDSVGPDGQPDLEAVEKAKLLHQKAELTFPMLIPDETQMNGRLQGVNTVPETFFVDQDGNIVGETYTGARSFEDWKKIVEDELAKLEGGN